VDPNSIFADLNGVGSGSDTEIRRLACIMTISTIAMTITFDQVWVTAVAKELIDISVAKVV
jgi:hypothetical protein